MKQCPEIWIFALFMRFLSLVLLSTNNLLSLYPGFVYRAIPFTVFRRVLVQFFIAFLAFRRQSGALRGQWMAMTFVISWDSFWWYLRYALGLYFLLRFFDNPGVAKSTSISKCISKYIIRHKSQIFGDTYWTLHCMFSDLYGYLLEVWMKAASGRRRFWRLLTLLQLPLIEVSNAMRAYCYSIASYP